jgi:lysozyme family protein
LGFGITGAAKIFQRALGVKVDGSVGPVTLMASAKADPEVLLSQLRDAREWYERHEVGYRARFWRGLVNRWDKAYEASKEFLKDDLPPEPEPVIMVS